MANDSGYLLDNQQAEAGTRFDALATLFNPSTFRHIEALGIAEGWRCWEVAEHGCGVSPRTIRSTRLFDLVNTLDPKLVAAAFGMDPQAPLIYLADAVDPTRLPDNRERT